MVSFALLASVPAWSFSEQTDTVGGTDTTANGNQSYKLNLVQVHDHEVRLKTIEMDMRPTQGSKAHFVVYQQAGNAWNLVWDSGAVSISKSGGLGFRASPDVNYDLLPNEQYAIGIYLGADSFDYAFADRSDEDVGWGVVNGVLWAWSGTVPSLPDPITTGLGGTQHYDQRLTVEVPDDADSDGVDELTDCDDTDPAVHPGAPEVCNGKDDDCNDEVDDGASSRWYVDADGDGYGDPSTAVTSCDPPDHGVADGTDCDDANPDAHPGAEEACNGVDDDCDGSIGPDEGDSDGDGALDCGDCAPDDPSIAPGLDERCDGVDHDCDGVAHDPGTCDAVLQTFEPLEVVGGGCGCDGAGAPGGGLALVGILLARRGRRAR